MDVANFEAALAMLAGEDEDADPPADVANLLDPLDEAGVLESKKIEGRLEGEGDERI